MTLAQFIESQEGRKKKAYPDASGHSIGVGHFLTAKELDTGIIQLPSGGHVLWQYGLSDDDIDSLLLIDIGKVKTGISQCVHLTLNKGQQEALTDFVFNEGVGHFRSSTLLKLINQCVTDERIHDELKKWNLCQGKVHEGLKARRELEWDIWTGKTVLE